MTEPVSDAQESQQAELARLRAELAEYKGAFKAAEDRQLAQLEARYESLRITAEAVIVARSGVAGIMDALNALAEELSKHPAQPAPKEKEEEL